jgi:hypothetical protein
VHGSQDGCCDSVGPPLNKPVTSAAFKAAFKVKNPAL